jgi:hypothetical protein
MAADAPENVGAMAGGNKLADTGSGSMPDSQGARGAGSWVRRSLSWLPAELRPDDPAVTGAVGYSWTLVLSHLLALVLVSLVSLNNNRALLFRGYDGKFYETTTRLQHQWLSQVPWLGQNPLQALGNGFFCVNTRLSPAYLVFAAVKSDSAAPLLSYVVIAVETFLSVLVLARCWRVRPAVGIPAAWLMTLLSLPYTFPFALYPISELSPHAIEVVAAQTLMIGLFHCVGRVDWRRSVALTVLIALLGAWLVCFCPAGVSLCVPGLGVYFLACLAAVGDRRERRAKAVAVVALLAAVAPTVLPYLAGTLLYAVPTFFSSELQNDRISLSFVSLLFHGTPEGWFGPFLVVGSAAGAVLAWGSGSRTFRSLALGTLALSGALIAAGLFVTFGMRDYRGPSPLYFEFGCWPFYCLLCAFLVWVGAGACWLWVCRRLGWRFGTAWAGSMVVLLLPLGVLLESFVDRGQSTYETLPFPPRETPIVTALKQALSLRPGDEYRGSVATFTGFTGKPAGAGWMDLFSRDWSFWCETGNDHRAIGLWYHDIPTVHEYNQLMTPPYYLMVTRLLARERDRQMRCVVVLTKPHLDYLRSLGVRFVVTDFAVARPGIRLEQALPLRGAGGSLYLYELDSPNLGTYSPTTIIVAATAREAMHHLGRDGFDFAKVAVAEASLPAPLLPASSARLRYDRDCLRVDASSAETSVLLLPLQYSHCLEMTVQEATGPGAGPSLVRLNVMQTGLVFSGTVRVKIRFASGPCRNPFGRLYDYLDMRRLELGKAPGN